MTILFILYTLLFIFLMATVYMDPLKKYHTIAKTLNSIGYIIVSIYGYFYSGNAAFFLTMLPAFLFCLLGDFFLSLPSTDENGLGFYAGLISFALGHILFLAAFVKLTPVVWFELIIPIGMVLIFYFITRSPNFEMGNMTTPVLVYGFLVVWTFIRSVMIVFDFGITGRTLSLCLGSLLFMVSDIIILFIYFYKIEYKWLIFANLSIYYLGMFLLAASIYFMI